MKTPAKIVLTLSLMIPLLIGCSNSQAVDKTTYSATASQSDFSQAQLDAMLAPIALYPDTVLSHVLIAATYPLEVVEADRWARNNKGFKGDDAVEAADNEDWDPSVKALVAFPDILQRMSDDLDWTQRLGDAFLADEERVMDSIQTLRKRAYDSGTLDKVEHVRVVREEKVIIIEPSVERVVYVPVYDTRVVYGNWWWPEYPPVYWHYPSSYVFVSGFYWGPRVYIGPRFYFSACHWRDRRVVVIDRHHHHSHPRFYDSRSVVRYQGARHWSHNPVHRRGVAYHDDRVRTRYNSPRESYRDARVYRDNVRNQHIAPNQARDSRQRNNDDAGGMRNTLRDNQRTQTSTPAPTRTSTPVPTRADDLRARMNERAQNNSPSINRPERTADRATPTNNINSPRDRTSDRTFTGTTRTEQTRNTDARPAQPERQQEHRIYGIDRMNRSDNERSNNQASNNQPSNNETRQRIEERTQRSEQPEPRRIERVAPTEHIERTQPRMERSDGNSRSRNEDRGAGRESAGRESSGSRNTERSGRER